MTLRFLHCVATVNVILSNWALSAQSIYYMYQMSQPCVGYQRLCITEIMMLLWK